ncbi:uncharacterized protein LOC135095105 [Scylla paramamosain]|uniref:uncharacterized protein LOC135095105 n=1 Tax=Scylla paramamosain TaxID=85552 RepID=UPI0030836F2B
MSSRGVSCVVLVALQCWLCDAMVKVELRWRLPAALHTLTEDHVQANSKLHRTSELLAHHHTGVVQGAFTTTVHLTRGGRGANTHAAAGTMGSSDGKLVLKEMMYY